MSDNNREAARRGWVLAHCETAEKLVAMMRGGWGDGMSPEVRAMAARVSDDLQAIARELRAKADL